MPFRKSPFTGFPFDDSDYEPVERSRPLRSQLDDIAQRHPEFAEHLQGFPFRSNTWGRKRRGSGSTGEDDARSQASSSSNESDHLRQHRQPFGSRFDSFFGQQPFHHTRFEEEEAPRFGFEAQSSPQPQHTPPVHPNQKPPRDERDRGRKQNPNLPQSNTVDLGQKAPPVDENRGQRSMSAPPDNRSNQRFVSSIHIPVNHQGQGDMGGTNSSKPAGAPSQSQYNQQQPPRKPNERVIPIHVEGRDEPVIPKNVNVNQQQQHASGGDPAASSERMFGQEPTYFTQFLNRGQSQQQPRQQQPDDSFRQQQQQYQNKHQQQFQQQQEQPGDSAPQAPPPKPQPLGPIEQIKLIQSDVLELMTRVEQFNGTRSDKDYIYLDEMLTRNLLKLDNIETEGKENIRTARKEAIKCIQSSINILEAKANENTNKREQEVTSEGQLATGAPEEGQKASEAPQSSSVVSQMEVLTAPDSSEAPEAVAASSRPSEAAPENQEAVSSSSDVQVESSGDAPAAGVSSAEQKSEPMDVAADSSASQACAVEPDSQTTVADAAAATTTSSYSSSSQDTVKK